MALCLQPVDLRIHGWAEDPLTEAPEGYACGENHLGGSIDNLTENSLDGDGVFDVLMQATKLHLQEEFNEGRITGKEYATVYLGALNSVLGQSVQFLLNNQQINKLNAEIGLLRQKAVTELAQTDDTVPNGLGFNQYKGDDATIEGRVDVLGMIQKQKGLFQKQTDGFDRDAEQKLTKIMVDTWAVRQTTDGALTDDNGLDDVEIGKVVTSAKDGIGVS